LIHNVLIALHAAAGVVCFVAGVLSLGLSNERSWRFQVYAASLLALVVLMVAAVAADWHTLDGTSRWVFLALIVLGLYMVFRAARAGTRLRRRTEGWRRRYLDDLGFTLISLFDGFVIVSAIDVNAPVWLVVLIAVLGVVAGVLSMNRVKARLGART
jgi:hypothetical protein